MGIEPTGDTVYVPPNGFEDRGHHQVCKHLHNFRYNYAEVFSQTGIVAPVRGSRR